MPSSVSEGTNAPSGEVKVDHRSRTWWPFPGEAGKGHFCLYQTSSRSVVSSGVSPCHLACSNQMHVTLLPPPDVCPSSCAANFAEKTFLITVFKCIGEMTQGNESRCWHFKWGHGRYFNWLFGIIFVLYYFWKDSRSIRTCNKLKKIIKVSA